MSCFVPRLLNQVVVAGPAVQGVLPPPADQDGVAVQGVDGKAVKARLGQGDVHLGGQPENGSAKRLAGDTDGLLAVDAVDDDGVSRGVGLTRAEHGVSLLASPVDLLGEGLGTAGEVRIAAV